MRSRLLILEAATKRFAAAGFDDTSVKDVAEAAGLSVGLVCRYFPTREHLALAIYDRLGDELAAHSVELAEGDVGERFVALMRVRIAQCEKNRRTLTALLGRALDPQSPLYLLGSTTEGIRAKVQGALGVVVASAGDAPAPSDIARYVQLLYTMHLGIVLATLMRPDASWALALLQRVPMALTWSRTPLVSGLIRSGLDGLLLDRPRARSAERHLARELLEVLFRDNRVLPGVSQGLSDASEALHLPMIESCIRAKAPLQLVLPAFPAKAPNPHKVLGALPDLAERRALERLSELLDELEAVWPAGVQLTICSDGHVFADAVGLADAEVDRYRHALLGLLDDPRIGWFDLSTAFGDAKPAKLRAQLMSRYAASEEALRERAARSPALAAQLDGIHRFLFEDEHALHPQQSKNAAKKKTRALAYEVVRRSEAWGALVTDAFPRALRLSIHPQPDPSTKIGVNLLGVADPWLTPWHAAAVVDRAGTRLMHRSDAEALGARLVLEDGLPSHLELP
ncbi:MAG: L-tyrosine/L-tryptophan isonitrile synthase family protein [Polyangia bacterium]